MRTLQYVFALCFISHVAFAQEPFHETLTSTAESVNDEIWSADSRQVTPNCEHDWSITKETLRGGRQEGVDIITVDNGVMQIVLCPTRGMGILKVTSGDLQLKWDSPVKEVVNPQFVNLASRGGLGWLEGFNEFLCRCGLENNGHPGTDKFINNVGDEAEMELTLHGKIANIPASKVEVVVDRKPPFALRVKGQVYESFLFGPKLQLQTELVVLPGENTFQLNDTITNKGAQEQEFQLLYHANFGSPLLAAGAEVLVPTHKVTPFNDHAAAGMKNWSKYEGPTAGFVEQVYLLEPKADHNGHTMALLVNRATAQAASIGWSTKQLPYLTVWKNTGAAADGYVTGIEPGTNYPNNRSVEREAGRVPKLAPGESREMTLTFGLHSGGNAVEAAINQITVLQMSGQGIDSPNSTTTPRQ